MPPNIILVLSDQQRWDTLGCYGQPRPVTPNLDKLAQRGTRYEYAFTCQPLCGPARAALQTGQYPTRLGIFRNHIALPRHERTIAHHLNEAGYRTCYLGKWHLASTGGLDPRNPVDRAADDCRDADFRQKPVPVPRRGGYQDWLAADVLEFTSHGFGGTLFDRDMQPVRFSGYRPDRLTDFALQALEQLVGAQPFFLFLSYVEPHHQNDRHCFQGPPDARRRFADFAVPGDLADMPGDWTRHFPDYLGCCAAVDANVGRLLQHLDRLGLSRDTVLIYTSDHGCHFRTRNAEYKRSCHEASIRVPLIIAGPGFEGPRVVRSLVSLIDLPPTLLRLAAVTPPGAMDGRALQPLTEAAGARNGGEITPEQGAADDEDVFIQVSESEVGRALRTRRWKYGVHAPDLDGCAVSCSPVYTEACLYDLAHDPHERANLVRDGQYRHVREQLAGRLQRRIVQAGEPEPEILPVAPG